MYGSGERHIRHVAMTIGRNSVNTTLPRRLSIPADTSAGCEKVRFKPAGTIGIATLVPSIFWDIRQCSHESIGVRTPVRRCIVAFVELSATNADRKRCRCGNAHGQAVLFSGGIRVIAAGGAGVTRGRHESNALSRGLLRDLLRGVQIQARRNLAGTEALCHYISKIVIDDVQLGE